MNILIPIMVCTIVATVAFFIGKSFSKAIKPTIQDYLLYTIDNVEFENTLNPLVKDIYLQFIEKDGPKYFQETNCDILISNMGVEFWSENSVLARRFTRLPESVLKTYNMTAKEINDTLSVADKTILDKIAKSVKVNNKEFISRLFI